MIDATNPANVYDAIDAIVTRASERIDGAADLIDDLANNAISQAEPENTLEIDRIDTNRSVAIGLIWEGVM